MDEYFACETVMVCRSAIDRHAWAVSVAAASLQARGVVLPREYRVVAELYNGAPTLVSDLEGCTIRTFPRPEECRFVPLVDVGDCDESEGDDAHA